MSTFSATGHPKGVSRLGVAYGSKVAGLLETLESEASQHDAIDHPYLQALAEGTLDDPRGALQDFARAYAGYSTWFPRFLAALETRLPETLTSLLDDNKEEETGRYDESTLRELEKSGLRREWVNGIPHPELFRRFQLSLDVAPDLTVEPDSPVSRWREAFLQLLLDDHPAAAVGALGLGTEFVVGRMYAHVLEAVDRFGEIRPEGRSFLVLHSFVDDAHAASLLRLAASFATEEDDRRALARGMHKALDLRAGFWTELHARAEAG